LHFKVGDAHLARYPEGLRYRQEQGGRHEVMPPAFPEDEQEQGGGKEDGDVRVHVKHGEQAREDSGEQEAGSWILSPVPGCRRG